MAAAELKLQVGLDLAFFRQQLAQLASASVGYSLPINIDRLAIQKEITKLGKNISNRKYTLKIDTTVKSAASDISSLQKALEELEKKSVNIQITGTGTLNAKEAKKIRTALRTSVLANGGKIEIPATIKAAITQADIRNFRNAVKSKLTGLSVDVKANVQGKGFAGTEQGYEGLMGYMQKQGLIGKTASGMTGQMGKNGDDIKQQLSDAVKSAEKIKSIFDGVAKSIATTGKSTANIQGKRLGLANIPLMSGGVERRIEQSSAGIGRTISADALKALYPEVSKTIASFTALKGQIQQNTSKLSGFSLILSLAAFAGIPLAKSVVKLTGSADNFAKLLDELGLKLDAAFTKAASNILSATSGRLLSGGSMAGLLPAAYRGIGPSAGPAGLLPPAYRGIGASRNAGALPPAYRGLPAAYRGIEPSTGPAGLLPTAYRGIAGAPVPRGLGGTAFGTQKYLPTALGNETKKVLRDAAHAFLDTARQGIREVKIQDFGNAVRTALPQGPQGRSPLMLPPAGGTTAVDRIRVSTGAYVGQPGFMQAPSIPSPVGGGGAPPAPPTPPGGGRGGFGSFGSFRGAMPNVSLPGAGLVKEVGDQFGYAAQQVLLFGTTYKALAFLTDFPTKVGDAVAQLQNFRNTLTAVTGGGQEFGKSNKFILDLVEKYNIPLQSARDGFAKLYASMAPAGFKGDEIRNIFTGISQGAATFGMSADKVDRVNYAFAQMASKGQVMSEELKGQLGDVLPGAVAIFAEAAGFKGPDALVKFTKAMEDGRYKGEAMKQLLINVGIVMKKEFGPGAEGAARTFQGLMNRMQNATTRLYEAFEPAAIGFANKVVLPMTDGLKVLTDGFNAFFTQTTAKTAGGNALAQQLNELKPSFDGIQSNLKQLLPTFQLFGNILLGVAKTFTIIAGNPITGFLLKLYANVLLVNTIFTLLGGKILVNLITNISASIGRFIALNVAVASLQRTSAVTSSTLAGTQVQMALLSRNAGAALGPVRMLGTALAGLLRFGIIAIGINVVISGLAELDRLKQSLDKIGSFSSKQYRQEIKSMSKEDINSRLITNRATQASIKEEQKQYKGLFGKAKELTTGRPAELRSRLVMAQIQEQELIKANKTAKTQVQLQSQVTSAGLGVIPPSDGGGAGSKKKTKAAKIPLEQLLDRSSSRAAQSKAATLDLALNERILQAKKDGNEQEQASLENLRPVIKLRGELAALTEFHNMLVKNEAKIVGKSLTQAQFKERLQLAGQKMTLANIDLENAYVDLQKKELENSKQILDQQQDYQRTLEDIRIKNGEISDEEIRRIEKNRQYQDILKANPSLSEAQKGTLQQAINAAPTDVLSERLATLRKEMGNLADLKTIAIDVSSTIGNAFATAFQGIINGTATVQDALAGFFQSVGESFVKMAMDIIAKQMTMIVLGFLMKALGLSSGGGLSDLNAPQSINNPLGIPAAANGATFSNGIAKFATGGIVNGPTLFPFANGGAMQMGLMGEAGPEAIMPLQRGADGSLGVRAAMGGNGMGGSSSPILNMSFETSTINGVEYVSRDQLEAAMMQTRRQASSDGAKRGMAMTLDKIQQSPQTRRRIGM